MAYITSVSGNGFKGEVENSVGKISWVYDERGNCCEDFGVNLTGDLTSLEGKNMINFSFQTITKKPKQAYGNETYTAILTFKLENENDFVIEFYNCQNGFYCHNLDIFVDEKLKYNVSL